MTSARVTPVHRALVNGIAIAIGGVLAAVAAPRVARLVGPDQRTRSRPAPTGPDGAASFRRAAIELQHRAVRDALDGLRDREGLERELRDGDRPRTVVVIDLDGVTSVIDQIGTGSGDELLRQVGQRLRSLVREPAGVRGLDATRFVVVVDGDRYVADAVARRMLDAFAAPFSVSGLDLVLDVSVGIAEVDVDDPTASIERAGLAAFRATTGTTRIAHAAPAATAQVADDPFADPSP